jgi:hypothetical protein
MKSGAVRTICLPLALVGGVALLTGCSDRTADGDLITQIEPEPAAPPIDDDVPVMREIIVVGGMEQQVDVVPFEAPPDFPKSFSTLVPLDIGVQFVSSGEGDVIRFEAMLGGVHRPDALLSFTVLPEGTSGDDGRELVADLARERGGQRHLSPDRPWADDNWQIPPTGFLALSQHGTRWFYFFADFPPELSAEMQPRIDLILRRWVFTSDGVPLMAVE